MPASGFSTTSFRVALQSSAQAVADAGQQAVNFIAQTAFRQGHIQHHPVGLLLLDRRQRGAQAVQLVQIDRKPDGVRAGG